MSDAKWPRRAEFVNMVLAWAVAYGYVDLDNVEFDGVAGKNFDTAIRHDALNSSDINEVITFAIKLGVPVEGLVADGEFGAKWAEVVALAKSESAFVVAKDVY